MLAVVIQGCRLLWHEINGNLYQGRKWKTQGRGESLQGEEQSLQTQTGVGTGSQGQPLDQSQACQSFPLCLVLSETWELWGEVWSHNFLCSRKQSCHPQGFGGQITMLIPIF